MEKETVINNIEIYNKRMDASIEDKLWFLSQNIVADIYVDFGCANGNMLRHMYYQDPGKVYIGYDNNLDMLSIAKEYCKDTTIKFIYNFKNIRRYIDQKHPEKKVCLILSSVLHEVYSYAKDEDEIKEFWKMIKEDLNPDYIVIRDMTWWEYDPDYYFRKFPYLNHELLVTMQDEHCNTVKSMANQEQVMDFEKIHGPIDCYKRLTHFLLKYKYVENWDREVNENYFSYNPDDIISEVEDSYEAVYMKKYHLPYLHDQFKKDFNIDFMGYTHYNMFLKKI